MKTTILTILFGPIGFLFGITGTNARKRNQKVIRELRAVKKELKKSSKPQYSFEYKGFLSFLNY